MSKELLKMARETIKLEEIEKPLSARESMKLAELEHAIVKDFAAFYRVGQALSEINKLRLYRTQEGRTFEQYCKELWDMGKSTAYQVIDASEVYDHLQLRCGNDLSANCGHSDDQTLENKMPLNEAQVRPLTRFKDNPERISAIWKETIESAPNGKVTASHVKRVVQNYLGEKIKKTVHKAQQDVAEKCSAELSATFDAFSKQLEQERKSGYKHTSRTTILKMLDQLRAEIAEDGEAIEDHVLHGQSGDLNKLQNAGFSLFRTDRTSITITQRTDKGSWQKHSGPFETLKDMDAAFKTLLQDEKHLRG